MTKTAMRQAIDKLYAILSKRATENVLLHRKVERLEKENQRLKGKPIR